jgi:hypothetical protein
MSLSLIAHIQGEMHSKILVVEWFDQRNGEIAGLLYSVLAAARRLDEGAHHQRWVWAQAQGRPYLLYRALQGVQK